MLLVLLLHILMYAASTAVTDSAAAISGLDPTVTATTASTTFTFTTTSAATGRTLRTMFQP